jgi:dipeptidyl aminopeptidase/acylaminoacyl peptidase
VATHDPDWTADGTRLAYERGGTIYVRGAWIAQHGERGSVWEGKPRRVVSGYEPSWSPSGARMAYAWRESGNLDVYVARDNGSGMRRLTSSPEDDHAPSWSPNGRTIAYTRGSTIRLVGVDGSGDRRLGDGRNPDWASNGKRLAFEHEGDIWIANADGSGRSNLTRTPDLQEASPSWSPDVRSMIAYAGRLPSGEIGLYKHLIGGSARRVLVEPLRDRPPIEPVLDWQPVRILVATVSDKKPILALRDATGKPLTTLRPGCYVLAYVDRSSRNGITSTGGTLDPFGKQAARRTVKLVGGYWPVADPAGGCYYTGPRNRRDWLLPGTYRYWDPAHPRIQGSFRVIDSP